MTNISKNIIDKAKLLVDSFYSGEISPEDEMWLKSFFTSADNSQLPDDMAVDAEIFRMLNDESVKAEDSVPDDLEERLRLIMKDEPTTEVSKRKGVMIRYMAWAGAAAAAIILALNIIPSTRQSDVIGISYGPIATAQIDEDGYYEITDADEAARLIAETMAMASDKLTKANTAISKTDKKVKTINETINKMLNHKSLKTS